jgi:hypothetical protein
MYGILFRNVKTAYIKIYSVLNRVEHLEDFEVILS